LLDEPFGALDWFLRREIITDFERVLLVSPATTILVTHETREATFLADRVLLMSPRPGTIQTSVDVDLPRPRPKGVFTSPQFHALCDKIDEQSEAGYEQA